MPRFLWAVDESALRRALLAPLLLAEGPYRLGALLHRWSYASGWRGRVRLPARVISVGNLTVGGSGKTPMAAWLARALLARGRKVAVLARGVGGRRGGGVNVVSDGQRTLAAPADVGDEPIWIAGECPGVAVLAGRNRAALGLRARAVFGAEVLILDDGFQHHRLERDVDLVCLDADVGLGNGHVLPRGPLREPPGALQRADAIIWTRGTAGEQPRAGRAGIPSRGCPEFHALIEPRQLRSLTSGGLRSLDSLRGEDVGLFAGIARPDRLERELGRLGAKLRAVVAFPDHHPYTRGDIESLDAGLRWVTTGKDAVKIPVSWAAGRQVDVLEEEVRVTQAARLIEWLLARLDARPTAR